MLEEYDCIIKYHNYIKEISFILNIMFLILMPKIYSFDNIYLSIIWTLLGIANAVYLLIKQRQEGTIKRK